MIHSMTGFGRAAGALSPRYFATVTAKSVNHRFLETSVRLPEYMWDMEAPLRALGSEVFSRGKLDLSIRIQRTQQPEYNVRINTQIANTVIPITDTDSPWMNASAGSATPARLTAHMIPAAAMIATARRSGRSMLAAVEA